MEKEAKARIKINKLLEESEWRFFKSPDGPVNIIVKSPVKSDFKYCQVELGKRSKDN